MLHINFDAGELRPAPRKDRPHRRETWYPVTCSECGASYWLRKPDALRRERCRYCGIRKGLLTRTHWTEELVQEWLDEAGIAYVREAAYITPRRAYFVDFKVGDVAVEINGWGHKLFERKQRDRELAHDWPGQQVVFIDAADLRERPTYARDVLLSVF